MCEEKEAMEMMRLGGSFWEDRLAAVEKDIRLISQEEGGKGMAQGGCWDAGELEDYCCG
jgi:hypothetical protein